jgi:para-nitrobenzyl esterase
VAAALGLAPALACLHPAGSEAPVVAVTGGRIRGALENGAAVFRGVPFAAPPVGALRWRPPAPVVPWQGVREAAAWGPICPQDPQMGTTIDLILSAHGYGAFRRLLVRSLVGLRPEPPQSEDCLTLNVRTRNLGGAARQPVMVWIHGGAHRNGSGSMSIYNGDSLVLRGVVLVTVNYRLGVLGFLAHPALSAESFHASSGNYGTLDHVAALEWVRDNIASFGGDPGNVTIFGESAGGHSVGQLMASPLARGLFHRAIAESGAGSHQLLQLRRPAPGLPAAEAAGVALAARLGVLTAPDPAAALRAIGPAQLLEAADAAPEVSRALQPVVDGWVFPRPVAEIFAAGEQAPVPLLIGSNADEGNTFPPRSPDPARPGPIESLDAWREAVRAAYGEEAGRVLELYPVASEADLPRAQRALFGDSYFGANARYLAARMQRVGQPAFLYFFNRGPRGRAGAAGAFHGAEIAFVFGEGGSILAESDTDAELSRAMGDYWVQFAKRGDPNLPGRPAWPAYDSRAPQWLELGARIQAAPVARAEAYDIFDRQRARNLAALAR